LNRNDATNALRLAQNILASYVDENGTPYPFTAQLFSALNRTGIEEADAKIRQLTGLDVLRTLPTLDDNENVGAS
jgi:GTP-binding protein